HRYRLVQPAVPRAVERHHGSFAVVHHSRDPALRVPGTLPGAGHRGRRCQAMSRTNGHIQGIIPILPTPFGDDGAIDEGGMRSVISYVLEAGAHGVAFPAMASEFYALTDSERLRLTELVVREVGGAVPVVGTA